MGAAGTGEAREESGGASIEAGCALVAAPWGADRAGSPAVDAEAVRGVCELARLEETLDPQGSSVQPVARSQGLGVAPSGSADQPHGRRLASSPSPSPVPASLAIVDGPEESDSGDAALSSVPGSSAFGTSVAFAGDLDSDGVDDFLVGAPKRSFSSPTVSNGGTVFMCYMASGGGVREVEELAFAEGDASLGGGSFGSSIAVGGVVAVGAPKLGWGSVLVCRLAADGTISGGVRLSTATEGLESVVDSSMAFGAAIASQHNHGVFLLMVGAPDFDRPGLVNQDGAVVLISLNATTLGVITARRFDTSLPKLSPFGQDLSGFGSSVEWLGRWGTWGSERSVAVGAPNTDRGALSYDRGAVFILIMDYEGQLESVFEVDDTKLGSGGYLPVNSYAGMGLATGTGGKLAVGASGLGTKGGLVDLSLNLVVQGTWPSASPSVASSPTSTVP
ncbi:hypothetical protein FNF27_08181 [Cafeteria roenbergensis]|uniref:Integrin alpha-2 domain-containing protein n=1 Tax=Cafeteria roenbergensis TaxID=33653 RepID=A0A5A8D6M0_CAFRO|nr:hypothetical protein FNF27_08181 [Cafeteria roenbergensis]